VDYVATTLDGSIATADGGVEWLDEDQGTGEDHGFGEMWESIDGLLMGRKTYEVSLSHEPWMAPDKDPGVPLFEPFEGQRLLQLVATKPHPSGIVQLSHVPRPEDKTSQ